MAPKINQPVGAGVAAGKGNKPDDVKLVQQLLNKFIAAGAVGSASALPETGMIGSPTGPTITAIKEFQKAVLGFAYPDGRVDPGGKTFTELLKEPASLGDHLSRIAMAVTAAAKGAPAGIPSDLWYAAMGSLIKHAGDSRLKRAHLVTLVDFRPVSTIKRLWVVDLPSRTQLRHELVTHGSGSAEKGTPSKAVRFSNTKKSNESSVGGYVTLHTYTSSLGGRTGPGMVIDGLDPTNAGARSPRGIRFHGATYVKTSTVGNSHGCFATNPTVNDSLVALIENGTFVYAYAGDGWKP